MSCKSRDLTIEEALVDPVIGAAMRADHVDPRGLEALLRSTARRLGRERADASLLARVCAHRRAAAGATASW
jgi:hypothetical protein